MGTGAHRLAIGIAALAVAGVMWSASAGCASGRQRQCESEFKACLLSATLGDEAARCEADRDACLGRSGR